MYDSRTKKKPAPPQATIAGGGVIPHLHKSLINKQACFQPSLFKTEFLSSISFILRWDLPWIARVRILSCLLLLVMQGKKEGMP